MNSGCVGFQNVSVTFKFKLFPLQKMATSTLETNKKEPESLTITTMRLIVMS